MNESELLNTALISMLVGGGTYAGLRGIRDMTGTPKTQQLDNELEITLPSSRIPKPQPNAVKYAEEGVGPDALADKGWLEIAMNNAGRWAMPVLAGAGGLYGGFRGASSIYEGIQNKQLEQEKEEVKKNYVNALQRAGTKIGSLKTPNVDKFLEACLDKRAGILSSLAETIGGGALDLGKNLYNDFSGAVGHKGKELLDSSPVGLTAGTLALLGLGTAGATSYIANRIDENKEDTKRKSNIPTEIRLNVQ